MNFSVRSVVKSAMQQTVRGQVVLCGDSEFMVQNNLISWGGSKLYTFEQVNETFGMATKSAEGFEGETRMYCGKSTVSVFDFGLLYSVFSAIALGGSELGGDVSIEEVDCNLEGLHVVWFNNDGVVYSADSGLIIQVCNADSKRIVSGKAVYIRAFTKNVDYILSLDAGYMTVTEKDTGVFVCRFGIPLSIRRTYSRYFIETDNEMPKDGEEWDETSGLGSLVLHAGESSSVSEMMEKYANTSSVGQVVVRDDLIFIPRTRYKSKRELFGSWAFTDKCNIVMPINNHGGLLVYSPLGELMHEGEPDIAVLQNPKFNDFYNVTAEVNRIVLFAKSVVNRPLTAAEMDMVMFDKIKSSFMNMELDRIPLNACFGRVVVPENNMKELGSSLGDRLYCIVPVGAIGDKVVLMESSGDLNLLDSSHWVPKEEYYYDITSLVGMI